VGVGVGVGGWLGEWMCVLELVWVWVCGCGCGCGCGCADNILNRTKGHISLGVDQIDVYNVGLMMCKT